MQSHQKEPLSLASRQTEFKIVALSLVDFCGEAFVEQVVRARRFWAERTKVNFGRWRRKGSIFF